MITTSFVQQIEIAVAKSSEETYRLYTECDKEVKLLTDKIHEAYKKFTGK